MNNTEQTKEEMVKSKNSQVEVMATLEHNDFDADSEREIQEAEGKKIFDVLDGDLKHEIQEAEGREFFDVLDEDSEYLELEETDSIESIEDDGFTTVDQVEEERKDEFETPVKPLKSEIVLDDLLGQGFVVVSSSDQTNDIEETGEGENNTYRTNNKKNDREERSRDRPSYLISYRENSVVPVSSRESRYSRDEAVTRATPKRQPVRQLLTLNSRRKVVALMRKGMTREEAVQSVLGGDDLRKRITQLRKNKTGRSRERRNSVPRKRVHERLDTKGIKPEDIRESVESKPSRKEEDKRRDDDVKSKEPGRIEVRRVDYKARGLRHNEKRDTSKVDQKTRHESSREPFSKKLQVSSSRRSRSPRECPHKRSERVSLQRKSRSASKSLHDQGDLEYSVPTPPNIREEEWHKSKDLADTVDGHMELSDLDLKYEYHELWSDKDENARKNEAWYEYRRNYGEQLAQKEWEMYWNSGRQYLKIHYKNVDEDIDLIERRHKEINEQIFYEMEERRFRHNILGSSDGAKCDTDRLRRNDPIPSRHEYWAEAYKRMDEKRRLCNDPNIFSIGRDDLRHELSSSKIRRLSSEKESKSDKYKLERELVKQEGAEQKKGMKSLTSLAISRNSTEKHREEMGRRSRVRRSRGSSEERSYKKSRVEDVRKGESRLKDYSTEKKISKGESHDRTKFPKFPTSIKYTKGQPDRKERSLSPVERTRRSSLEVQRKNPCVYDAKGSSRRKIDSSEEKKYTKEVEPTPMVKTKQASSFRSSNKSYVKEIVRSIYTSKKPDAENTEKKISPGLLLTPKPYHYCEFPGGRPDLTSSNQFKKTSSCKSDNRSIDMFPPKERSGPKINFSCDGHPSTDAGSNDNDPTSSEPKGVYIVKQEFQGIGSKWESSFTEAGWNPYTEGQIGQVPGVSNIQGYGTRSLYSEEFINESNYGEDVKVEFEHDAPVLYEKRNYHGQKSTQGKLTSQTQGAQDQWKQSGVTPQVNNPSSPLVYHSKGGPNKAYGEYSYGINQTTGGSRWNTFKKPVAPNHGKQPRPGTQVNYQNSLMSASHNRSAQDQWKQSSIRSAQGNNFLRSSVDQAKSGTITTQGKCSYGTNEARVGSRSDTFKKPDPGTQANYQNSLISTSQNQSGINETRVINRWDSFKKPEASNDNTQARPDMQAIYQNSPILTSQSQEAQDRWKLSGVTSAQVPPSGYQDKAGINIEHGVCSDDTNEARIGSRWGAFKKSELTSDTKQAVLQNKLKPLMAIKINLNSNSRIGLDKHNATLSKHEGYAIISPQTGLTPVADSNKAYNVEIGSSQETEPARRGLLPTPIVNNYRLKKEDRQQNVDKQILPHNTQRGKPQILQQNQHLPDAYSKQYPPSSSNTNPSTISSKPVEDDYGTAVIPVQVSKADPQPSYQMCIVRVGYPEVTMNSEQIGMLRNAIMDSVVSIPEGDPQVRFLRCRNKRGRLKLDCLDADTVTWLRKTVRLIRPWMRLNLMVLKDGDAPPPEPRTICFAFIPNDVPGTNLNDEIVLARLKKMNSNLQTQFWKVLNKKDAGPGQSWTFSVDSLSMKALEAADFYAFFGLGRIKIRPKSTSGIKTEGVAINKPSGGKVGGKLESSKYQWRKV